MNFDDKLNKLYEGSRCFVKDCRLWRSTSDGALLLANFVPIPAAVIKKDDGNETITYLKMQGVNHKGKSLPEVIIPAEKLTSTQWIASAWDYQANFAPGNQVKEHLRYAITYAGSNHATYENIYTYTGWRKINDEWIYLYNGGAIGKLNATVELENSLSNYKFPEPIEDYREALEMSYKFKELAPDDITIPLLSMIYISPLNEFLRQAGHEPAYITFLLGVTGSMKSTLTALALSHFGDFNSKNLPSSFKDTANAIEKKGFLLKDSLTAIDHYYPSMQKIETPRMEKTAQAITRSYSDRTGRSRVNSDTSLKGSCIPRGNLIIIGEDIPNIGQSGIARHLILELKKGDIDKGLLTELQSNSDQLNLAMRGYIEWLLPQAETLPNKLKEMFLRHRKKAQNDIQHALMPETVAWLQIGYEMFLTYATSLHVIDTEAAEELKVRAFNLFMKLGEEQSRKIDSDKPTVKFINALRELLATSSCHVKGLKDMVNEFNSMGFIGYEDDHYYYLYGDTTVKEIVQFYNQQGITFPVSKLTLLKHLEAEGLIEVEYNNNGIKREKQKKIRGENKRLIWLKKLSLIEAESVDLKHMII